MALSKSKVPCTVEDTPVIAQHYLVCGTEDCENNCLFYCNPCHRPMCEQCRDEHQKSLETKSHEVVPYRQRQRRLPVEKCNDHPSKDIDMICEDCQVPLCYKCAIQDHRGHMFADLETIYSKNFILCLDEVYTIHQYYLPTSQDMQRDIKEDATKITSSLDKIRAAMKAEAESLKRLVEKAMSDNLDQVNKMEESLREMLQGQDKTYEEYNGYLENLVKDFQGYMIFDKVKNNPIIFSLPERLKIKPIPETTEPVYPEFTAGQFSEEDIAKLLGKITETCTTSENRKIKPIETASSQLKPSGKQNKQDGDKIEVTKTLSSIVTKVGEYTVPGVDNVFHISPSKSGWLWGSDYSGNLVQTDLQGRQLEIIKTNGKDDGYHTVTKEGDMLFTDTKNKVINKLTLDRTITEFIKTRDWKPLSIYSSHNSGDILVGMVRGEKGKITRYNKTGKEIQDIQCDSKGQRQDIQWDSKGQRLFSKYPHYITENINGDICVSDYMEHAVVVVDKSGQHRFSYTGQELTFTPFGICTDILGHILVCDIQSSGVHLLNQDGQFLSLLITSEQGIDVEGPCGVCVDNENHLHVGQNNTNTVTVYRYLQ